MNSRRVLDVVARFVTTTTLLAGPAMAQDLPGGNSLDGDTIVPGSREASSKKFPGDPVIPMYPISDPQLRQRVEEARQKAQEMMAKQQVAPPTTAIAAQPPPAEAAPIIVPEVPKAPDASVGPAPKTKVKARNRKLAAPVEEREGYRDAAGGVRLFTRNLSTAKASKDSFALPSTSIALATLLYGIEATATKERWVPAELNYAWLGPNGAVVEMKNCRLWIKVTGDYSTERLYGGAESMSCRAPSGETFDIPIEAYLIDEKEEYLGARGELVARGKALASALSFLSDGVQAFGTAMASSQVQTDVAQGAPYGAPVTGTNVGGDKNKYIAGQTLAGSTAKFLNWWIDYYQSLSPTIAIGPGKKVYLAVRGSVEIPKIFFGQKIEQSQFESVAKTWGTGATSGAKVNTTSSISRAAPPAPGGTAE